MKAEILKYINELEGFKVAIKNLHWSAKKMSEHQFLDTFADDLSANEDEIAEIAQGLFGKINKNEVKAKRYKVRNSKKLVLDVIKCTEDFHKSMGNSKDMIGIKSVVENFIGILYKSKYLLDMTIKEDIKRSFKPINEGKKIHLSESKLHTLIYENIKLSLNGKLKLIK